MHAREQQCTPGTAAHATHINSARPTQKCTQVLFSGRTAHHSEQVVHRIHDKAGSHEDACRQETRSRKDADKPATLSKKGRHNTQLSAGTAHSQQSSGAHPGPTRDHRHVARHFRFHVPPVEACLSCPRVCTCAAPLLRASASCCPPVKAFSRPCSLPLLLHSPRPSLRSPPPPALHHLFSVLGSVHCRALALSGKREMYNFWCRR